MGRNLAAVVLGYVVMFVVVMATFSVAFLVMGADRAFRPGTYEVTGSWILVSTVLSFGAAVLGGVVAARVGRGTRAASLLAVVVVVLGVILAIPTLDAPDPGPRRTGEVGNFAAMMEAQQPPAVSFLNPVIGAVGVMVGGRARKPRAQAA
jgi:amino acid transporter